MDFVSFSDRLPVILAGLYVFTPLPLTEKEFMVSQNYSRVHMGEKERKQTARQLLIQ